MMDGIAELSRIKMTKFAKGGLLNWGVSMRLNDAL
jgi:hypothetical protein